jgi:hypothetical protein
MMMIKILDEGLVLVWHQHWRRWKGMRKAKIYLKGISFHQSKLSIEEIV